MPIDPASAAVISGGLNLQGGVVDGAMTEVSNFMNRRYNEKMYRRQRQDNIEFWRMQNEYNHPQQQMERLRSAGLNPHLVYGGGPSGASGSAGSIQTPDVQPYQHRSPQFGSAMADAGTSAINQIYDLEIKQAQTNNLKAQNSVLLQEALLKAVQTEKTATDAQQSAFNLDFNKETREISHDMKKELLRQMRVQTDLSLNRDARDAAQNSSNLQEALERMINMKEQRLNMAQDRLKAQQEIRNLKQNYELLVKEGRLKSYDSELRSVGVNSNDPAWLRMTTQFLINMLQPGGTDGASSIWDYFF